MKQFNTLNQLVQFSIRERMAFHPLADVVKPFKDHHSPEISGQGFAAPSERCLLRWAHKRGWPMGPALRRKAAEAARTWGR